MSLSDPAFYPVPPERPDGATAPEAGRQPDAAHGRGGTEPGSEPETGAGPGDGPEAEAAGGGAPAGPRLPRLAAPGRDQVRAAARRSAPALAGIAAAGVAAAATGRPGAGRRALAGRYRALMATGAALVAGAGTYAVLRDRTAGTGPATPEGLLPEAPLSETPPFAGRPSPAGGDLVDLLSEQHRQLDDLLLRVASARGTLRREALDVLADLLHKHHRAEQRLAHPLLRAIDAAAADLVRRGLAEQRTAETALADLIALGPAGPRFDADLDLLRSMVGAHTARTEREDYALLRARIPAGRLHAAAARMRVQQGGDPW